MITNQRARLVLGLVLGLSLSTSCAVPASGRSQGEPVENPGEPTAYRILGDRSFLTGYDPINSDGTVNVVVEIPAGTTARWEVTASGMLEWERDGALPRYVDYLAYPGNYGMVPRTWRSAPRDGEPLDVLILGTTIERGRVARTRIVGVLELVEDGLRDDKLIGVNDGTAFADVHDIDELERLFPGVRTIVETWFTNHLGPGRVARAGWGNAERAMALLEASLRDFEARNR